MNTLRRALEEAAPVARTPAELTVGVEHELFLETEDGAPPDHATSQAFFAALEARTGWTTEWSHWPRRGDTRVACVDRRARGVLAVKYEHHPHLIEIASSPAPDLVALAAELEEALAAVDDAASEVSIRAVSQPFASVPAGDPRLRGEMPLAEELRAYRMRTARAHGRALGADALNFSAAIAATQIQIGGLPWWRDPSPLSALYAAEPGCLGVGLEGAGGAGELLARRWRGYLETLPEAPLVGFPALEEWTWDAWVEALASSPHLVDPAPDRADGYLASVRDLQLIRPRVSGTVEHRGDPAQRDATAILRLAALRLGVAAAVHGGWEHPRSFANARSAWWRAVRERCVEPSGGVVALAHAALERRGMREATMLRAEAPAQRSTA